MSEREKERGRCEGKETSWEGVKKSAREREAA